MLSTSLLLALAPLGALGQTQGDDYDRDNVVICLDASGSMKEPMPGSNLTKMEAARQAIATVLAGVPTETQVGLLVFSGSGKPNGDWVYPLGERDDPTLIRRLNRITPNSGTPLGEYMVIGTEELIAQRIEQNGYGTYRLLVVTDGEASDKDVLAAVMPDIRTRGLMLDVIGVNMNGQHSLANDVSSYRSADDSAALQEAIRQVFAEVGAQGVDDMAEDFQLLAAFPDGSVKGVIERIAEHDDGPIVRASRAERRSTGSRPGSGSGSGRTPKPSNNTAPVGFDVHDPEDGGSNFFLFAVVAAMVIFVIRAKSRASNR